MLTSPSSKATTTSGILYSRQVDSSGSTSPGDEWGGLLLPPTHSAAQAQIPVRSWGEPEELVTPCQGLLRGEVGPSFPLLQELIKSSAAVAAAAGRGKASSVTDEGSSSVGSSGRGTASTSSIHKKTQYHKTKLCPWHKEGKCFMGAACNYAHSREELRPKPDLSKTKLCPEIVKHKRCDKPGCRFAHDFVELRATSTFFKTRLCKFWQRGYCPAGPDCRHAHGREDLRQQVPAADSTSEEECYSLDSVSLEDLDKAETQGPVLTKQYHPAVVMASKGSRLVSPLVTTAAPTPITGGSPEPLTPLYLQCAELLATPQYTDDAEVLQLLRRLAGEDLLPQGLLETPKHNQP